MADSAREPRTTRKGRRQAAPPALLSDGEPFAGFNVLDEWREPRALLLWQALRDGLLWASTPAPDRHALFSATARERRSRELRSTTLDPELVGPLRVVSGVLDPDGGLSDERLAAALRALAGWAEAHDFPRTAISFAQGAALVLPRHPAFAYTVGLYCRRNAEYDRAETWFRRARVLSWRADDRQSFALSWIGLGNVYLQRGDYEAAKAAHLRALRVARRRGFWHVKAMALHDLFTIAVDQHRTAEAERLAQQAARAYPVASPRLVHLAHDVATFWMNQGFYQRTLIVFHAVSKLLTRSDERLFVLASLGRAAAGVGDIKLFTDAWVAVHLGLDRNPTTDRACVALLMLAYGAAALEDWTRVELAARHAMELARHRGESEVSQRAQVLINAVPERRFSPELLPPPDDPAVIEEADNLARLLVRRLTTRAG